MNGTNGNQPGYPENALVPYPVIVAATKGDPDAMKMTPHTLRHTFCTTLANAGMNPKALQYIMGHSNINMTLNYYAHTTSETSITEMKRLIA